MIEPIVIICVSIQSKKIIINQGRGLDCVQRKDLGGTYRDVCYRHCFKVPSFKYLCPRLESSFCNRVKIMNERSDKAEKKQVHA